MSKNLDIDGVRFESSASVAQRFNYTQDYIGKLAREGKIVASKIDRFWFIEVDSFEQFLNQTACEKVQRSNKLRRERKCERAKLQKQSATSTVRQLPADINTHAHIALAQSVVVVCCGLLVGTLGLSAQGLQFAQFQQGGSNILEQAQEVFASVGVADLGLVLQSVILDTVAVNRTSPQQVTAFADLPVQDLTPLSAADAGQAPQNFLYPFSDQVEIVREENGVQIVRPVIAGINDTVEYRVSVESISERAK